jgi:RNA polymerase sigma-70 factor (ECF subfamily)
MSRPNRRPDPTSSIEPNGKAAADASPGNGGASPAKRSSVVESASVPEDILLKYWPQISFRVKNSIGRSTPDWEDVGSEILLAVVEAIRKKTFRGESALGTFIYSITSHKIIDHIRRKRKLFLEMPEPGTALDPYLHVENEERVKLVAKWLKKLRPRDADMIYLRYYLDLSQNKIGEIYGLSPGRVSVVIAEARTTLKKLMEDLQ